MLIKYEFLKGRAVEVEVAEEIGAVILQIEDDTYKSDRRETRRHESLSDWNDKDGRAVDSSDVMAEVFRALEAEALHRATATLKPDEQDLIHRLYLDKPPMTQAEYARQLGTTVDKVKDRARRIRNKLKRLL